MELEKKVLLVEDNQDDVDQFSEAVRQLGVYWLMLNEPAYAAGRRAP